MRKVEHLSGRLGVTAYALLIGTILLLFGYWCLDSTNIPRPALALPLPRELLKGSGFILWNPFTLIPLTVILTSSRFLVSKLSRRYSATVTLAGIAVVLLAVLWVPNPIILWPFSVLGDHTLAELIGKVLTFHIVPSPKISYSPPASFEALIQWQVFECGARFVILLTGWTACVTTIWKNGKKRKTTYPTGLPAH